MQHDVGMLAQDQALQQVAVRREQAANTEQSAAHNNLQASLLLGGLPAFAVIALGAHPGPSYGHYHGYG